MKSTIVRWGALGLVIAALAGCGGGSSGTTAAAPGTGGSAAVGTVTAPTGTAPVTITALTTAQAAALTPAVTVGGVTIASPPVVTFAVSDGATTNNPILGLTTSNLRFALAKLVPGTGGSPSKWVSYIVTSTTAGQAQRPSTDTTGTLVDNKNGTYTYTFARDIAKVKDEVAAMTMTAPSVAADLGDLTYDPNLTHRMVIQLSGGGIDNTNAVNAVYDFIPATGKAVAATDSQREVVAVASCNECHQKLSLHGSRNDTRYCVVCHTDQRKFGQARSTSTALAFPALVEKANVNTTTGITSYLYSKNTTTTSSSYHPTGTDPTYVADGETIGDFAVMVHKIHNGAELIKQNYNYANVAFNNKGYSMLGGGQKMCSKCHDSAKAAQADNYASVPSRQACGACHDGIKWSDGTGTTLAGATTGHVGKAQSNDGTCALCHGAADIKAYHQTENVTSHNPTIATGLVTFTYEIKSVTVDSSNNASIVFKINKDGTPITLAAAAAGGVTNPLTGFTGGPSFLLAYATDTSAAVDGIASPVDYNNTGVKQAQAVSVSIAGSSGLLNSASTDGSISGPDSSGYYTAKLLGTGTKKFPVGAKLRTVGLQGYFTQAAGTGGIAAATARHAISVVKTVTGDTARRTVVDKTKCSNCHEWFEGHGGNRVYDTQICVMCHVPGLATSGRGISDAALAAYTFSAADNKKLTDWGFNKALTNAALKFPVTTNNFKDMIHGIHAGRDRVTPFIDARDRTPSAITLLDMRRMDFPGVLKNCETCHAAGTYSGVPLNTLPSTYESIDAAYAAAIAGGTATTAIAKTALSSVSATDTVTSPFAAACVSCHDGAAAQAHIKTQGGQIKGVRTASMFAGEACGTCHGAGKAEDPAVVHK